MKKPIPTWLTIILAALAGGMILCSLFALNIYLSKGTGNEISNSPYNQWSEENAYICPSNDFREAYNKYYCTREERIEVAIKNIPYGLFLLGAIFSVISP